MYYSFSFSFNHTNLESYFANIILSNLEVGTGNVWGSYQTNKQGVLRHWDHVLEMDDRFVENI